MTKLEQPEDDVKQLSADDLKALGQWFDDYRDAVWDQEIAADAKDGSLDQLLSEAHAEIKAGVQSQPISS